MKSILKLIFILAILSFFISSCDNTPIPIFRGVKSKTAKHLGEGVWIDVPPFYEKANTYDGFQAPYYESSISLQVDYASFSDVVNSFDKDVLTRKRTKLMTLEKVKFGEADSAVYSVVLDKRKKNIRYLLSIHKDNKMYGIKAFCREALKDKYDSMIKRALESVAFGEVIEKEEPFVMGRLISFSEWNLTRDGLFPTESEDNALINVKVLDFDEVGNRREDMSDFLKKEIKKYNTISAYDTKIEKIEEGYYITIKIDSGDNRVFGAYVTDGKESSMLFIGTSDSEEGLDDIDKYIRNQNIKTVVGIR